MTITSNSQPTSDTTAPPSKPGRRRRTTVVIVAAAFVVAGGGVIALDLALDGNDHDTKVFDQPVNAVDVHVSSGSVEIVGTDGPSVTVEMTVSGGIRGPNHREMVFDDHLVIDSTCPVHLFTPSCAVDYVIHVPSHVAVNLDAEGANADITSISGAVDVDVSGGDVDITFDQAPQRVKAHANGGRIDVVVPDDGTAYDVDASSNGGSTHTDVRTDPTSDHTVDLHANGGSVTIEYANG